MAAARLLVAALLVAAHAVVALSHPGPVAGAAARGVARSVAHAEANHDVDTLAALQLGVPRVHQPKVPTQAVGRDVVQEEPADMFDVTLQKGPVHCHQKQTGDRSFAAFFCAGVVVGTSGTVMALALLGRRNGKSSSASDSGSDGEKSQADHAEETDAPGAVGGTVAHVPSESPASSASPRPRVRTSVGSSIDSIHLFWPRLGVLMALMLLQSLSSVIMHGFHFMLVVDPAIAFYLTMIVGTGGNMGAQSVVLAVRKFAVGETVSLGPEMSAAARISVVLAPLAFARCWAQSYDISVSVILSVSTFLIILAAAWLGTATTMVLHDHQIDPAHATPIIQVLMDILGILVVCLTAAFFQPFFPP